MWKYITALLSFFFISKIYSESAIILPDIIVTPDQINQTTMHEPTQAVTYTAETLDSSAQSMDDLLQNMLGAQLNDLYGDGTNISLSMRGFGDNASSNSLILINGVPQLQPDLSTPTFNNILLDDIQSIMVLPDSASVLYGDQAIGGVINIITYPITKEATTFNAYVGSFNTLNARLSHSNYLSETSSYALNGQVYHSDNYRDHNTVNNANINGKLYYQTNDDKLTLNYNGIYQTQQFAGALTRREVAHNRQQAQLGEDSFGNDWANDVSMQFSKNVNAFWQFKLLTDLNYYDGWGKLNNTLVPNSSSSFEQYKLTSFINPIVTRQLDNHGLLTLGGSTINDGYQFDSGYAGTTNTIKDYRNQNAIYGYLTMFLMKQLSLDLGLRAANFADYFSGMSDNNGHAVVADTGLNYFFDKQTKVYIKRSGNYRFPKVDEEVNYTDTGEQVLNPLKPQIGVSYSLGLENKTFKNQLNTNVYLLKLNNEIEYIPTAQSSTIYNNENIAQTERVGAMFSDIYRLNKRYSTLASVNWVDPKITGGTFSGNQIPDVPSLTYRLRINMNVTERIDTYIEDVYTGSMYAAGDTENLAGKQGGYSLINIGVNMHVDKSLTFYLKAKNIFNKEYNVYTVYNPLSGLSYYPAAGISVYAGVRYRSD